MSRSYHFHAGAHRTGTSSFQMCLHENRQVLENAGFDLAYPGRDGIPTGTLRLRLPRPRHGHDTFEMFRGLSATQLAQLTRHPDHPLILSEENIPGALIHLQRSAFFPAALKRAQVLRQAMGDVPLKSLIYVVRDYASFYKSTWRKWAEDKQTPDFSTIKPALMQMDRGWPEVIITLQEHLKPERLIVVEHGARHSRVALLRMLVPETEGLDLRDPGRALNVSATDAGLLALQDRYSQGETLDKADVQAVIRAHVQDKTNHNLTEFTAAEQAQLDALYVKDIMRLCKIPDVEFIS